MLEEERSDFILLSITKGSQSRTWGSGECFLLMCSPCFAQFAFLYVPGISAQGWHYPQWSGPSHVNYQSRKCPYRHAHRPIWQRQFLSWGSFLLDDPACIKLTREITNNSETSIQFNPVKHLWSIMIKKKKMPSILRELVNANRVPGKGAWKICVVSHRWLQSVFGWLGKALGWEVASPIWPTYTLVQL